MNILLVSHAVAPLSGEDSVAQLCGSLPKALRSLDHQAYVLTPLYSTIDPKEHSLARRLLKLKHTIDGTEYACELWTGRTIGGAELVFIGHESFGEGFDADSLQAQLFVLSALELLKKNDNGYALVHGQGWLGGKVVSACKEAEAKFPLLYTPHGEADANALQAADTVTTTRTMELPGYEGPVSVIRGGIDNAIWNPLTDPELPARFDPVDIAGKAENKRAFQLAHGLPTQAAPLVVLAGDHAERFEACASMFLRNDVQLVVVGDSSGARFEELAGRWSDRCALVPKSELHRAYAAADFVLLCDDGESADGALIAHRYGALPIAVRAGAYDECLVDFDAALVTGNALLVDDTSADSLLAGARRAAAAFAEGLSGVRKRVMRLDHGWDRSARLYERAYGLAAKDAA